MVEGQLYESNLACFKEHFPEMARILAKPVPNLATLVMEDGKAIDLELGSGRLYKMPAEEFARQQLDTYFANPERVVDAIGGGVAGSWILNNRSDKMLNDDYPLGFRTRLHRKDLGIALDTARQFKVPVPIASLVATIEDALIAQGFGDEDMSNLARFVREGAGVPNGPMKA